MANPGLTQAKNKIDDIFNDAVTDRYVKQDSLRKVMKYTKGKLDIIDAQIATNPPSATNVPAQYELSLNGKPFARMVDGAIVPL